MAKLLLISSLFIVNIFTINAQTTTAAKDTSWKSTGYFSLNANQAIFSNWAAGGYDAFAASALVKYKAYYEKGNVLWKNDFVFAYGVLRNGIIKKSNKNPWRKNDDRINIVSDYAYKARNKFYYAGLASFRTQFAPGYANNNFKMKVSDFMAPAFLQIALGFKWTPEKYFSLFLSPATGKYTFVNDQTLADAGSFGVEKAVYDVNGVKIKDGKKFRPEFGASLMAKFDKEVAKNVNWTSTLNLFNNYTDADKDNAKNIDVSWENSITFKLSKFLGASVFHQLLYDDNILVPLYENLKDAQGVVIQDQFGNRLKVQSGMGKRLQQRFIFGVGFSYNF